MSWLSRRQRDGGVDPVPLPHSVPGSLWLCGKQAIGPDPRALVERIGDAARVVCLCERHELVERYPAYVAWLEDAATPSLWFPIHDLGAPPLRAMTTLVEHLASRVRAGDALVVHCGAGKGRAGTTAVCLLLSLGVEREAALERVAKARPGAGPEAGEQVGLVRQFPRLQGALRSP